MMKKVTLLLASVLIATNLQAGKLSVCGTKITCKAGVQSNCRMEDGSTDIFRQVGRMDFTSETKLYLSEVYAYKAGDVGVVDCYYFQEDSRERFIVYKTLDYHNVIPSDNSEWIQRFKMLYCDPDIHSCLLYKLY